MALIMERSEWKKSHKSQSRKLRSVVIRLGQTRPSWQYLWRCPFQCELEAVSIVGYLGWCWYNHIFYFNICLFLFLGFWCNLRTNTSAQIPVFNPSPCFQSIPLTMIQLCCDMTTMVTLPRPSVPRCTHEIAIQAGWQTRQHWETENQCINQSGN